MARTVAEGLWEMLASAGVQRCYGIVGDALNPVIDARKERAPVIAVAGSPCAGFWSGCWRPSR